MTKANLRQLGIDAKAERVYRVLLRLTDARASEIAYESGIKRTSVYYVLEELVRKGLVSTYRERGVTRYFAEHPRKLQERLVAEAVLAGRLAEVLIKDIGGRTGRGDVRVFTGPNGIRSIIDEVVATAGREICSAGSSAAFLERHGHHAFGARRRSRGIHSRAVRFERDRKLHEGSSAKRLSAYRYLPKDVQFSGNLFVFKEGVAFISDDRGGFGFIVRNNAFRQMMSVLFESLWQQAH